MQHILKCQQCDEFTMNDTCKCGGKAVTTRPPRYSPTEKLSKYRREAKRQELERKNLL